MGSRQRLAFLAFTALASTLLPTPPRAHAYVRTLTCDDDDRTSAPACPSGLGPVELFWPSSCVVYHINQGGCDDIADDQLTFDAIRRSAETWSAVDCSTMTLIDGGFTDEDRTGYNACDPTLNANVVLFRDRGWSHQTGILALTIMTYEMKSGRILDADIELNDQFFTFTATDDHPRIDVQNTVTHEIGHLMGLNENEAVAESTMYPSAPSREIRKRDLDQDDIDGVCAIYPLGTTAAPECSGAGTGFFRRPEQGPNAVCETDQGCCSTARPRGGGPAWVAALLAAVWLVRRRQPGSVRAAGSDR